MTDFVDYYDVLGVDCECSETDIKKAYRKLAMEYHPDKHMMDSPDDKKIAEDKFKEINKAYEILSDPVKRQRFDDYGESDFGNGSNGGGMHNFGDPNEIFKGFFQNFGKEFGGDFGNFEGFNKNGHAFMNGKKIHLNANNMSNMGNFGNMANMFGGMFNGMNGMNGMDSDESDDVVTKDEPVFMDLALTLEQLYNGCKKKMKLSRTIYTGPKPKKETEIITIDVKPGWKAGTKITFNNKGDVHFGRDPADIIFVVKQKPHSTFTREGNDIVTFIDVNVNDLKKDIKHEISGIDGELISIVIRKNTIKDSNYVHKILNKGMPIRKEGKNIGRGDLLVRVIVKF